MTADPNIYQQSYQLFVEESGHLLQEVEQQLLELSRSFDAATIYSLMRATHTLKGAAANVGRDTIKTIAHQLEDIFRALQSPDATWDEEIEQLLWNSYECLRLALNAELQGEHQTDATVVQRAQTVFNQLKEKLGACLDYNPPIPTSSQLGFDLTQSIFEVEVKQRLEKLAALVSEENTDAGAVAEQAQAQMEVFVGLAESLALPGLKEIAQTTLAALAANPSASLDIVAQAIVDLEQAREAVLAGDHDRGGEVSAALKQFAQPSATRSATELSQAEPTSLASAAPSSMEVPPSPELQTTQMQPSPQPARDRAPVRVEIEQLEQLSHLVSELTIEQNQLALRDLQTRGAIAKLANWLRQHRQTLNRLHEQSYANPSSRPARAAVVTEVKNDPSQALVTALEETTQLEQAVEDLQLVSRAAMTTVEREQRLAQQLQDSIEAMRMLPIGKVLHRFPPMVEQLSRAYHKPVELTLQGTQVLIDKAIAQTLFDALLHLVRNAFDHGIETAEIRQQCQKPVVGQIEIRAFYQGNRTIVEVKDDGQGLDVDKICQRAYEQGLVSLAQIESIQRSPQRANQLLKLLCQPGFSTVSCANDLSGRGIGLDVVYSQMQAIGGTITVSSVPQQGTTFSLQIRGALMNARLLVCQAGQGTYALIADEVEQVLMPAPEQIEWFGSQKVLHWRNPNQDDLVTLPVYGLASLFAYPSTVRFTQPSYGAGASPHSQASLLDAEAEIAPILLLSTPTGWVGLEIDAVVEEQELVIKPVSETIVPPPYVYGCTVLADGRLALVIDGAALVNYAQKTTAPQGSASPTAESARFLRPQSPAASGRNPLAYDYTNPYGYYAIASSAHGNPQQALLEGQRSPAGQEPSDALPSQPAPPRLLVVDDSITERQTLAMILQKAGYRILQAADGLDALTQLKGGASVNLIVCDLEMPRLNGLEVLRLTRQDPTLAHIPIVVLTSRTREKYQQIAFELGASAYITKPYLDHELLAVVQDNLVVGP